MMAKIKKKTKRNGTLVTPSTRIEILRIQEILRKIMFSQGRHYADLATHLSVSLSTAKRLLLSHDLPFERTLQLCRWLEVDLVEVLEMAKVPSVSYHFYTLAQEEYLANHPKAFAFLRLLMRKKTVQEIMKSSSLKERDVFVILEGLAKNEFLEFNDYLEVRLLVAPRADWRVDGPLWQTYMRQTVDHYIDHFFQLRDNDERHFEYGQRMLTKDSYEAMKRDIDSLYKKYAIISELETRTFKEEKLLSMTCLMLVDRYLPPAIPSL